MEAGYDKVKLWIDRVMVGEQYPTIANYLDSAKQEKDLQTGEIKTSGNIANMKVSIFAGGLSILGSLPKLLYGNNVLPLTKKATGQALEKLADTLHLQLSDAKVTEIEFGANFLMKHPVLEYLSILGEMPRFVRVKVTTNSIRYERSGKTKVFAFYDKRAEIAAKGMSSPDDLGNLLRYEMRLKGRLPYLLSLPEVKASTLIEADFCRQMNRIYQNEYFSIDKYNKINTDVMKKKMKVSEGVDVYFANRISQTQTGFGDVDEYIAELKQRNAFAHRNDYSRVKKGILKVAHQANISISGDLIRELDDEVKNSGAYV